ncbi:TolC family protein [Calditerrivibrio sp.]|uniref:TolC family protein n=1 Tax=Calditerrivibrio sp. TaxID=2792612 RepID=UPI003D0C16BE
MKICFKVLILSFFLPIIASAENVSDLKDLILLALKNNPSLKAAYSQKEIYKNKSKQIDSSLLPQMNLTGGYNRTSPLPSVSATKDSNNSYDLYSIGVDLKMNLYDFDKTRNLSKSYDFLEKSSEYDFFSVKSQIITNVTINFFRLLQAKENLNVAIQTRDNLLSHLKRQNCYPYGKR